MLRKTTKKITKRRKNSTDDRDRKRQIEDFISSRGFTKLKPNDRSNASWQSNRALGKVGANIRDRHADCSQCGSWTDDNLELRHYDWCPKYKKSRKNPITTRVSTKKYRDIAQIDNDKTSRKNIFISYQGKEIEFTGKDAEELRDIIKYQLKVFRGSSKLQRLYPGVLDNSGGFDTYLTQILREVYPKIFK